MPVSPVSHNTCFAMNTRMDIILWGQPERIHQAVFDTIREMLASLEMVLSRFNPQAETYRLNQSAAQQPMGVSDLLWNVWTDCVEYTRKTSGYFDVLCQSKIYASGSLAHVLVDKKNKSISFKHPGMTLDFGAVGKGIVLKQAESILAEYGVENGLISFGESSILARGRHPHGDYWPFAFQPGTGITETIPLTNSCLSISGLHGEKAHIINPKNQELSDNRDSVCVRSNCPIEAEVLSTALIAAPFDEHQAIMNNFDTHAIYFSNQL